MMTPEDPTVVITLAHTGATGAARMAFQYASFLRQAGYGVTLACGPPPSRSGGESILPEMEAIGVDVRVVDSITSPRPATVSAVAGIVSEGACLVIGINQRDRVVALAAARRSDVPCVIAAQNQHEFRGPLPLRAAKRTLYHQMLRRLASMVICTSEIVQAEVIGRFGVDPSRTALLPNAIDVRNYPRPEVEATRALREELGLEPGETMILNVGRLDEQKGQDLLIEAFARVQKRFPRAKLVIVGGCAEGTALRRMEKHAAKLRELVVRHELEDRVVFTGWRKDVPMLMRAADVYAHSARWEGWPLALVEAMAAETPVVTSDCAGRPTGFVDGRHGYVVPKETVGPLADSLERMLSKTPDERVAMGAAARDLALQHYDIEVMREKFVQIVDRVAEREVQPAQ